MARCKFIPKPDMPGYRCEHCGASCCNPGLKVHCVAKPGAIKYSSPKVEPTNCIHFLGPTGDQTESAKCGGCQTATAMTAVAECELHGLVTFIHRAKDEAFKCCKNCKDFSTA